MAKKRKKTDFTDVREHVRQAREYVARKEEELRQQRSREAAKEKPS
jgi:hypothetical protein